LFKAIGNGVPKVGEIVVIFRIKDFFLNEFPEPFDKIQIRGISGQVKQLDIELQSQCSHDLALLIARIIQHQRYWDIEVQLRNPSQQLADAVRVDVRVVCDQHQFVRDRIQRTQYVEALPPRRGLDEEAGERPQNTEKGT
jgi:hypothetical protein